MNTEQWIKCKTVPKEVKLKHFYCGASNNLKYILLQEILSPCRCCTNYIIGDKGRYSWIPFNLLNLNMYKRKLDKYFECYIGSTKDKIVFVLDNKVYIKPLAKNIKVKGKKVDTPDEYLLFNQCKDRVKKIDRFKMLPISCTDTLNDSAILDVVLKDTIKEYKIDSDMINPLAKNTQNIIVDIVGNGLMLSLSSRDTKTNYSFIKDQNVDFIVYDCKHNSVEIY